MLLIEDTGNINRSLFNYLYIQKENDQFYPPLVVKIENNFFQLNKFDTAGGLVLFIGEKSYEEALNISIKSHSDINIIELSNILTLAELLDINIDNISILKENGIKGDKVIFAIKKLRQMPEILKNYLIAKDISYKYIIILSQLNAKLTSLMTDYVNKNNPTLSDFRLMLTLIYDYKSFIDLDYFDEEYIKKIVRERNLLETIFFDAFNSFKAELAPVKVKNYDNFETTRLEFVFESLDFKDFEDKINYFRSKIDAVKNFYNLIKAYDIH
jgi:hypothetical protein